jgi:hypothetical protein
MVVSPEGRGCEGGALGGASRRSLQSVAPDGYELPSEWVDA